MQITRMKFLRLEFGYTLEYFIEQTGITRNRAIKMENATMPMTFADRVKISDLYQVPLEDFSRFVDAGIYKSKLRTKPKHERQPQKNPPCELCGVGVLDHLKCRVCDALIHGEDPDYVCSCGVQHAIMRGDNLCEYCHGRLDYLLNR